MSKLITDNLQTLDGAYQIPVSEIVQASTVIAELPDYGDVTKGDALIAVKLPLPGAVARTQHDRNKDVVYLEDFGAVGDGVVDDTAAIQAALDSGAAYVTNSAFVKKFYKVTQELLLKTDYQTLDLNNSEIVAESPMSNKSIIVVGSDSQIQGPRLRNITLISKGGSSEYQIKINNVGAFVVEGCTSYGYSGNQPMGFISVNRAVVGYIRNNRTEGCIDSSLLIKGADATSGRAVDIAVYDNRFVGGLHAARYGDYCEGIFFRRNICYAQTDWQLVLEASSPTTGLISAKIQENDFDTPSTVKGGIYIQNFKNVQINENWFANKSVDPMIKLQSGTDSIIISGNQAYPVSTFLVDNGVNTVVSGNMVIGGTTQIYFGPNSDLTTVSGNHLTVASGTCIDTNAHVNSLSVIGNTLQASGPNGGLTSAVTAPSGHKFFGNTGDIQVGMGEDITMTGSPFTYTVGARPVILCLKGGTVTNVSVNSKQVATSSNITIGAVPPGASVQISYTGGTPGFTVIKTA